MSTATEELVELDVDLDAPVPCVVDGCNQDATWHAMSPCCGYNATICDPCKQRYDAAVARWKTRMAKKNLRGTCPYCEEPWQDPIWRTL